MHAAITGFAPPFAPADTSLLPLAFGDFLEDLAGLNQDVAQAEADWKDFASLRRDIAVDIKERALRALARVKSNSAWRPKLPAVKKAADDLRGYRPKITKNPPPDDGSPTPRAGARADQSFGDLKNLTDKLAAALGKVPGYDTGAPADLTVAAITGQGAALDASNKTVAIREQDLSSARTPRRDAYDGPIGLREKMKAIKETSRSQYGSTSAQYGEVKSIRL